MIKILDIRQQQFYNAEQVSCTAVYNRAPAWLLDTALSSAGDRVTKADARLNTGGEVDLGDALSLILATSGFTANGSIISAYFLSI
jgi:hypothetical protein